MKLKKLIAVCLTAATVIGCTFCLPVFGIDELSAWEKNKAVSSDYCSLRGDADFDGSLSVEDARQVLRISVGLSPTDEELDLIADANGDGVTDVADARLILRMCVGLESRPEHIKEEKKILVAETCVSNGVSCDSCLVCKKYYNKGVIPSPGHVGIGWDTVKEATCQQEGFEEQRCRYCDITIDFRITPKSSHIYGKKEYEKAPNCFYPVNIYRDCKVCGDRLWEVEMPPKEHSFTWVTETKATCTVNGIERKICTHCGEITEETRPILAAGTHRLSTWKTDVTVDCSKGIDGRMIRTCLVCSEVVEEQIIKAEHTQLPNTYRVITQPTCKEEGMATYTCSVCRKTVEVSLEKTAHVQITEPETVNPTCTQKGSVSYTCAVCGTVTAQIPALGHVYATDIKGNPKWVYDELTGRPVLVCVRCDEKIYGEAPEGND